MLNILEQALNYHQRGELSTARGLYLQCLSVDAGIADAWHLLGVLIGQQGDKVSAIEHIRKAIALAPQQADYHYNLAYILEEIGEAALAEALYRECLKLAPNYVGALVNLGQLLGKRQSYIEASTLLERAIQLAPNNASAWINFGNIRRDHEHDFVEAERCYQTAAGLGNLTDQLTALENLGDMFILSGKFDQALNCFNQCITLAPSQRGLYLARHFWASQQLCDWQDYDARRDELIETIDGYLDRAECPPIEPFQSLVIGISSSKQLAIAQAYSKKAFSSIGALTPITYRHEKRRLGYISADFHDHPTAQLMGNMLSYHDREKFEVFAFALDADDGSSCRKILRHGADHFIELGAMTSEQAARRIQADNIDILIDVKGYTRFSRPDILAYRPAPNQILFLAYPGTMGAEFVDYIIADSTVIPQQEVSNYTEKILHMPDSYFIADGIAMRQREKPLSSSFVFCCFNNAYKIDPHIFDVWMRILRRADSSILQLLAGHEAIKKNIQREAESRGINPSRIQFLPRMPRDQYLVALANAHLFLDCSLCNAHTTAIECLSVGLPILTIRGQYWANRACESILKAINKEDLVADSYSDYEDKAVALALKDAANREFIDTNKISDFFDGKLYVKNLERIFHQL